MLLYIGAGAINQYFLISNKKKGRKFGFCGMMFGLCMIRLVTCSLRIAWACYPTSIRLGIAAQIFTDIGVVLLYFVNLFFAQRIVRAQHPHFGWTKLFAPLIPLLCLLVVLTIISLVVTSIQSFYTQSANTHRIDRDIELYGGTTFAAIAFIPFILVVLSCLLPKGVIDNFGAGTLRAKVTIVLVSATILTVAASFKAGTSYFQPPLLSEPEAWYFNRGVFYGFGFATEIVVLYFYAAVRVDRRFIVPDGAKGPFSYAGGFTFAGEAGNEKRQLGQRDSTRNLTGSSPSIAQSWGGRSSVSNLRKSPSRQSVISWGGLTQADTEVALGEDGEEIVPYSAIDDAGDLTVPTPIAGAEQELGYDVKSGKWILRSVSSIPNVKRSGDGPSGAQGR
ncbi:hypothetical protein MBLNU459_g1870t2 [Dothideomycetes sp. NU459]